MAEKTIKDMRKIILLTIVICSIVMTSCSSNKHSVKVNRPKPERIQTVLDSICNEGYNLFIAERVNWIASDSVLGHYSADRFGGNIVWQPTDSTWRAVFFDTEIENCIFEYNYNTRCNKQQISYNSRAITEEERVQWALKNTMWENALRRYGDSLYYNSSYGMPNFDFVRIDANTIRLYIIQGVERPNVIPFGNDFSIDFDNSGTILAFRRYHRSFIPVQTVGENGESITATYHSHLNDNPYITPTDICNFLLYRGEMKQTYVLSTALEGYIIYNAENNSAIFLTNEAMDRINNHRK